MNAPGRVRLAERTQHRQPNLSLLCMQPDSTPVAAARTLRFELPPGAYQINALPAPARTHIYGGQRGPSSATPTFVCVACGGARHRTGRHHHPAQFVVDMQGAVAPRRDQPPAAAPPAPRLVAGRHRRPSARVRAGRLDDHHLPGRHHPHRGESAVDPPARSVAARCRQGSRLPFGALRLHRQTGFTPGGSVDVTITYPATNPAPNGYAKVVGGVWTDASSLIVAPRRRLERSHPARRRRTLRHGPGARRDRRPGWSHGHRRDASHGRPHGPDRRHDVHPRCGADHGAAPPPTSRAAPASGARPAPCRSPAATPTASGTSPRRPAPPTSPATRPRSPGPTGSSTRWTHYGCRSRRC